MQSIDFLTELAEVPVGVLVLQLGSNLVERHERAGLTNIIIGLGMLGCN